MTTSIHYTNTRNVNTTYNLTETRHPLTKYLETRDFTPRDRPPSLAGRFIPREIGNTFWGRIRAFDHKSVKRMLLKEPLLIKAKWQDLTPITCLLSLPNRIIRTDLADMYWENHAKRLIKMLRILCNNGAEINSEVLLPYIERYHFHNELFAVRVFNLLLHRGLNTDKYRLLDENEVQYLEAVKHARQETYVFWGRKVISDNIRLSCRKLLHVYLRDTSLKPQLNIDVIGNITSFI
tara:strand:+ start:2658 stop:3365 length:708 start_codon:yes stop_codon:yes gene_type:complete